jgi:hypothetical protein
MKENQKTHEKDSPILASAVEDEEPHGRSCKSRLRESQRASSELSKSVFGRTEQLRAETVA